ncbi:hypothetical protein BG22_09830 [Bifidobacterium sp. UTBIF-78]|nr:hypothetical protein BG22_09830 [Bifidobacterium sp. UTBIF-78]
MSVAKTVAAVALAGAMVAAAVGLPAVSRNAYAEELSAQNNTDGGAGLCTPTTGTMGDSSGDINATDTGVATYVGGDMFVGKRSDDNAMRSNNGESGGGPLGSYAAEIEGATVVNGDLYTKLKKGFFTAGVVAFGSQFVPGQGTQVLTVGGNTATTAKPTNGSHAFAWKDPEAPALSSMSRSVVGVSDNNKLQASGTETTEYTASIAGGKYNLYGKGNEDNYSSVVAYSGTKGRVNWNVANPLSNIKGLDNGADETGTGKTDFTQYGTYLQDLSAQMKAYKGTDEMTVNTTGKLGNTDPNGDATVYTRYKYNWNNTKREASYKFEFDNTLNEKLITFHGDGKSALQVFTINADDLKTDNGQTGISYKFENIPENTSIVINVTGGNVEFHNGWRFLWQAPGETTATDLSNGYWNPGANGTKAQKKAYETYAERASKILWNFADATNVTIFGGQASGTMASQNVSGTGKWQYGNLSTDDDPAAAMMGSILVPNGNFESHVSTNGRVWVGGDFSMYNPTAAYENGNASNKFVNNAGQHSASVIDMDQERHNLPWSGNYTSQCASLEWSKVDAADGTKLLAGSSWAIYANQTDAENGTNPLKLVTDNEPAVDLNGTAGIIKVGGLNTNATYYVKEIGAPQDYAPSDVIYKVMSGDQGTTVTISKDVNGNDVTDGKIPNEKRGTSLTWKKTKEDGKTALAGTSWKLTKKAEADTGAQDQSWTVTDNTVAANAVNIYRKSDTAKPLSKLTMNMNETVQLTTKVTPTGALQKVVWSSQTADYQNILRIQPNSDGTSTAYAVGVGTVVAKACTVSEANGNGNDVRQTCATLNVTVTANVVDVFDVKANGSSITNSSVLTMKPKGNIQLNVIAKDTDGNDVTPTYESYATNVATVSETGLITAVADGEATIVVTAGNQTRVFAVKVSSADPVQYTYVYFPASGEGAWGFDTVWVHYGTGSSWQDSGHLTVASCDGNWRVVAIPRVTANNVQFGFQRRGDAKAWYGKFGGGNFTFPANAEAVTVSSGAMTAGYPANSSCSAVKPTTLEDNAASAARVLRPIYANDGITVLTNDVEGFNDSDSHIANDGTSDVDSDGQDDGAAAGIGASPTATDTRALDDVDSDAGEFKVIDLDDGIYWLTEQKAPDGYTVNKNVYKITIADGKVTWNGYWESSDDVGDDAKLKSFTNGSAGVIVDTPTEITWYKVSSDDKTPSPSTYLKGAQWKLTLKASDTTAETVYCVVDGNGEIKVGADNSATCAGEKLTDVSNTDQSGAVQNEADGIIKLTGLKFGVYELVETVAPDGYDLSKTTYMFVISQNSVGNTAQIQFDRHASTMMSVAQGAELVPDNRIPNKPGVELPDTGGIGSTVFVIGGTTLVIIAAIGLARVRRRRP